MVLNAEIASYKPLHEERNGVKWTHFPERITDGLTGYQGIRCACGYMLETARSDSNNLPINQPAPHLWVSFQAWKAHFASRADEAKYRGMR